MAETFIEKKNGDIVKHKLPDSYQWTWAYATREKGRGRAIGGIVFGVRREIVTGKEWVHGHVIAKEIFINKEIVFFLRHEKSRLPSECEF